MYSTSFPQKQTNPWSLPKTMVDRGAFFFFFLVTVHIWKCVSRFSWLGNVKRQFGHRNLHHKGDNCHGCNFFIILGCCYSTFHKPCNFVGFVVAHPLQNKKYSWSVSLSTIMFICRLGPRESTKMHESVMIEQFAQVAILFLSVKFICVIFFLLICS